MDTLEIYDHPDLFRVVRLQCHDMLATAAMDPRLAEAFATQQRWLMSHVTLAIYFRARAAGQGDGVHISKYLDAIVEARIASRNTADAFIKEMVYYKYCETRPSPADRRIKPIAPAVHALQIVGEWVRLHLRSLDRLTGGDRLATYDATPGALARIQPLISDGLVSANPVRNPTGTFSLFTWLDNGGKIMDWLMANMEDRPLSAQRASVGVVSTVEMAQRLKLSRTHLARKLREAELMGSIGWEGRRGHSVLWVSQGFREEYALAQAVKLAIIDRAFADAMARPAGSQTASARKLELAG
jgi:AraC-like DNA-binding protein